jgi:molybdopterin synthase catalytic subunit
MISNEPLDAAAIEAQVADAAHGAVVVFKGVVRDHDHGARVAALEYQAHPDAARFLADCCAEVASDTVRVAAAHREGYLVVGDVALVAAVSAAHRGEAFEACERLVDLIKSRVPIWKRQHLESGVTEWVGL